MLKWCTTELKLLTILQPRIWKILSDYIKKSNSLEEFKLQYRIQKTVHTGYD